MYLQLLAWLPVLSLYADAFITYVFVKSENPTWGGLCALFTAAGWAVSAHQALRHSSLSAAITIALAAVGMGPIAIVVGNKAYVKVKHAHERLNKLKLLVVIVQGMQAVTTAPSSLSSPFVEFAFVFEICMPPYASSICVSYPSPGLRFFGTVCRVVTVVARVFAEGIVTSATAKFTATTLCVLE